MVEPLKELLHVLFVSGLYYGEFDFPVEVTPS